MKYINKIKYPHHPKDYYSSLRAAMEIILSYSFDPVSTKKISTKIERFADLIPRLENDFYDRLFVHRDIEESIFDKSFSNKTVIITGYTGIGKTCLAVYNYRRLLEEENCKAFYVNVRDLKSKQPIPKISTNNEEKSSVQLCTFIYKELYRQLFQEDTCKGEQWANLPSYQAYRLKKHSGKHFDKFRTILELTHKKRVSEIEDPKLLEIATSSELISHYLEVGTKEEGVNDLINLLSFLGEHLTHVIAIFDNVDRFKLEIQGMFIQKNEDIVQAEGDLKFTPIICLRTSNIRRLELDEPSHYTLFIHRLQEIRGDDRYFSVNVNDEACRRFIKQRLDYLFSCDKELLFRLELNEHSDLQIEKMSQDIMTFLNLISRYPKFIAAINAWYNGSFRLLATEVFGIVSDIVSTKDGFIKPSYFTDNTYKLNQRRFRSYVFKRFANSSDTLRTNENIIKEKDIFDNFENISQTKLSLLKMKIIEVIINCKLYDTDDGLAVINYKTLKDIFCNRYGVSRRKLFHAINEIRVREEGSGLICVDKGEDRIHENMSGDTLIELFQAGLFFMNTLSVSCEYIFWMAINTDIEETIKLFPKKKMYAYNNTFDEKFKIHVAITFLENIVYQKTKDEMKGMIEDLSGIIKDNYNDYRHYFEINGKIFIERASARLQSYLNKDWSEMTDEEITLYIRKLNLIFDNITKQKEKYLK